MTDEAFPHRFYAWITRQARDPHMMIDDEQDIAVTVIDEDGEYVRSLAVGKSLLSALQSADVPIGSVCGGMMCCGTCHVYLEQPGAGAPGIDPDEIALLEDNPTYRPGRSRLACQVTVTAALAGRTIVIAPEN